MEFGGGGREIGEARRAAGVESGLEPADVARSRPLPGADIERAKALVRDWSLDPEQRKVVKEITFFRLIRDRPDLPRERLGEIDEIAFEFHEDSARVEELARDPDHGGKVTDNSLNETDLGLRLERDGRLRNVVRDPRPGCGDLIEGDGAGQQLDVYTPPGWRFYSKEVESELRDKIKRQRQDRWMIRVIANTAYLSPHQVDRVREIVLANEWNHDVMFGNSRRRSEE